MAAAYILTWTKPAASLEGAGGLTAMNGKLRQATDEFIALETERIREYKILSKESSLFKILLDSMIRDWKSMSSYSIFSRRV